MKTKNKKTYISKPVQNAVVDVLEGVIFSKDLKEFFDEYFSGIMQRYNLCIDPFTKLPCTSDEYEKNSIEYEGQIAIEKYGYCDWL